MIHYNYRGSYFKWLAVSHIQINCWLDVICSRLLHDSLWSICVHTDDGLDDRLSSCAEKNWRTHAHTVYAYHELTHLCAYMREREIDKAYTNWQLEVWFFVAKWSSQPCNDLRGLFVPLWPQLLAALRRELTRQITNLFFFLLSFSFPIPFFIS